MTEYSKLYLHDGGGLGDIIKHYVQGTHGWGYLESLKKNYPDTKIKLILTCINPQAQELIKYHPYIDIIEPHLWSHPGHLALAKLIEKYKEDYTSLIEVVNLLEVTQSVQPEIYLNTEDQKVVNSITSQGIYIFIHPFSGERFRVAIPIREYITLIDKLIDNLGYNVVIVGGTYNKNLEKGVLMKEEFLYERPGLFNLVNKTNARQCVKLARESNGFVGTWSCFLCAVLNTHIRTVVVFPNNHRKKNFGLAKDNWVCRIQPNIQDYSEHINSIVKHFN